ncbi:acyltransferase [Accumulibacter sp.]|jgi:acetyltransferase-like isoleucine patch superfamily enzyme|uniref:Chloramphenicol acetyltransferase n=1 Tax=Accumulibacter regalis TaxID=522306 RepID=C7RNQ0_ACCRE|nr:acyltransferase [Accumulibacter sp.]MBN8498369.1 acyltransferase [Accumulibacter sp.]MBO3714187.1 acyltransferase [Accumulibacter sp.]
MSFYTEDELRGLGLAHCGRWIKVSRKASIYNPGKISVGDYSRIDDFCVLSPGEGGLEIGRHVHIAVFSLLIGRGRIFLGDFSGLSSRVAIYSSNDDYSGEFMTNPTVPPEYTNVTVAPVTVGRHAIIGSGTVVLPGLTIGEGVAIGAQALVTSDCEPFGIYVGAPARKVKERKRNLLLLEKAFVDATANELRTR